MQVKKIKKVLPVDKRETLRWVIEAIDGKAAGTLEPGEDALTLLEKWR